MKSLVLAALVAGSAVLLPGPALAATYYVDQNHPNCDDGGPGTSENTPWCTLHRAVDGIPSRERGGIAGSFAPIQAGDTVYVKNGTYVDVQHAQLGAYLPANSGTANAPIAFRAYTPPSGIRHKPVVSRPTGQTHTTNVFSTSRRHYIIFDGFVLAPGTSVGVSGEGHIVENLDVNYGRTPCDGGNPAAIYLGGAQKSIVRFNRIRGATFDRSTGSHCYPPNAKGIYLISSHDNHVHNNEIFDAGQGIGIKRTSYNNIFELNFIRDVQHDGIALGSTGCSPETAPTCATHSNIVRNNIVVRADVGVGAIAVPGPTFFDNHIYNNTLFLVGSGIVIHAPGSTSLGLRHYNNIIHLDLAGPGKHGHIVYVAGTPVDLVSDYSVFYTSRGLSGHFYPAAEFGPAYTLTQWRRIPPGLDRNSQLVDPLVVGPLGATLLPAAFHLQPSSPARSAGRVHGLSSEAPINIGAYATGSEVIGLPAR